MSRDYTGYHTRWTVECQGLISSDHVIIAFNTADFTARKRILLILRNDSAHLTLSQADELVADLQEAVGILRETISA